LTSSSASIAPRSICAAADYVCLVQLYRIWQTTYDVYGSVCRWRKLICMCVA